MAFVKIGSPGLARTALKNPHQIHNHLAALNRVTKLAFLPNIGLNNLDAWQAPELLGL